MCRTLVPLCIKVSHSRTTTQQPVTDDLLVSTFANDVQINATFRFSMAITSEEAYFSILSVWYVERKKKE